MNTNTSKNLRLRLLVVSGFLAAFVTVSTMVIRIPTPTKGYINLGDCFVNISAWLLGPVYGAAAAGIGSALADIISGYTVYAGATLIIKALMAVASAVLYTKISRKLNSFPSRIIAAVAAEIIMVAGYALFEGILYGSAAAALTGVPSNIVQGIGGVITSVVLFEAVVSRVPAVKRFTGINK
ncbi:Uncharacterized membrane protein [Ruminococcus sp. YE71]|uniref:ECF transporter S component n=1 Tax=unclassified Ruminococcus TaxID=2608920 RepID=UPI000891E6FD|nr:MULTISPECIES: ECF transporter S component [unclassified Ruminococcus]SDA23779.1 Uncharacterized membrane protein [Ruminococcus sp. YE78]SFW40507.1 Uncharacterized membrane protein [Ruminococcus sp. YE71]